MQKESNKNEEHNIQNNNDTVRIEHGESSDLDRLSTNGIVLDRKARKVTIFGQPVRLTQKEFAILESLMEQSNYVVKRRDILTRGWGDEAMERSNVLEAHVKNLRKKIERRGRKRVIVETVRGVGYRLRSD